MHKTVADILGTEEKIAVLTSYDYTTARICDNAGIDILLVGDSAGMVMLGYPNTIPVTMEQMCLFTSAVSRARRNAMITADLPFMSYQASKTDAIANSGRLIRAGADAVKLEGGYKISDTVSAIVTSGIPVMGHIGLQPQTTILSQGYAVQGGTEESAARLLRDAQSLEEAGAFSIVLERVARDTAGMITDEVSIPTIGIGSGPHCNGQVLVIHDILGLYEKKFGFVKRYRNLSREIEDAVSEYIADVRGSVFPEPDRGRSPQER